MFFRDASRYYNKSASAFGFKPQKKSRYDGAIVFAAYTCNGFVAFHIGQSVQHAISKTVLHSPVITGWCSAEQRAPADLKKILHLFIVAAAIHLNINSEVLVTKYTEYHHATEM